MGNFWDGVIVGGLLVIFIDLIINYIINYIINKVAEDDN
jgi:hypothetical protein